jgi:hypothetical protein
MEDFEKILSEHTTHCKLSGGGAAAPSPIPQIFGSLSVIPLKGVRAARSSG